jgi:hypothetical protein
MGIPVTVVHLWLLQARTWLLSGVEMQVQRTLDKQNMIHTQFYLVTLLS